MRAQLLNDIQTVLAKIGAAAPILQARASTEKAYELFILSCVVRALQKMNAVLEPRDSNDRPSPTLRFRLGPGLIYSPTAASGFVRIQLGSREYELQNGLRVQTS